MYGRDNGPRREIEEIRLKWLRTVRFLRSGPLIKFSVYGLSAACWLNGKLAALVGRKRAGAARINQLVI